ncbi:MAG: ribosome biogenesis GTPase YlqF, partial [Neisseriaceae bacterium]|nr:ribosome biogenesis GTPase YlqF [Neisseriaceae bacterium]
MHIQWFPGHMYKAKKAIQNRLKSIDVVIEVLDARLPASSVSPLLDNLSQGKAKLKLLNKADLADSRVTEEWLSYFNTQENTQALAITSNHSNKNKLIIEKSRYLVPNRKGMDKPLRIMICGVPNVGKSSLINNLLGRKVTKTGNEAGVTKDEQRLVLADDIWLYDTPGMLWEKIIVPESGYRLAAAGSVGRNAYNDEEVALHLLD